MTKKSSKWKIDEKSILMRLEDCKLPIELSPDIALRDAIYINRGIDKAMGAINDMYEIEKFLKPKA